MKIKKKLSYFFIVISIYIGLMLVYFVITPNPYAAAHSGRVAYNALTFSSEFRIATKYIIIFSCILSALFIRKIEIDLKIFILIMLLITSGMYNGGIFSNAKSYAFNIIIIFIVSVLSLREAQRVDLENIDYFKINKYLIILLALGLVLALFFPNRFGYLPFEFSRSYRGEVTLWNQLQLFTLYSAVNILAYLKRKTKNYLAVYLVFLLIVLSTGSRAIFVLSIMPYILILLFRVKRLYKIIIITLLLILIYIFRDFFIAIALNSTSESMRLDIEVLLNGRYELWLYNFNTFKANIIFGSGAFFLDRYNEYSGVATSEIGFLKWFSENGIFFGIIMMYFVIVATIKAISILKEFNIEKKTNIIFYSIIYLSMLPNLLQSYSRILDLGDFMFYYSMFLLNYYKYRENYKTKL